MTLLDLIPRKCAQYVYVQYTNILNKNKVLIASDKCSKDNCIQKQHINTQNYFSKYRYSTHFRLILDSRNMCFWNIITFQIRALMLQLGGLTRIAATKLLVHFQQLHVLLALFLEHMLHSMCWNTRRWIDGKKTWHKLYMVVSKNRGKSPKMDGENNGKPY